MRTLSITSTALYTFFLGLGSTPKAQVLAGGMEKKRQSSKPSGKPSAKPSLKPSGKPSAKPSTKPSVTPSTYPSSAPSTICDPLDTVFDRFASGIEQCGAFDLSDVEKDYLASKLFDAIDSVICVATKQDVMNAINSGQRRIVLCSGTDIKLNSPIDVTNKYFEMRCLAAPIRGAPSCVFDGEGQSQLFTTSTLDVFPLKVKFYGIGFKNGKTSDSNGGAFYLPIRGGSVEFDSCLFYNNVAQLYFGGALDINSVSGARAEVVVMNSVFENNKAVRKKHIIGLTLYLSVCLCGKELTQFLFAS